MKPAKKNFTIEQGTTWRRRLRFNNLDLTGAQARMLIGDKPGGTVLADLNATNGRAVVTGGVPSCVDLELPASASATLQTNGVHQLDLTMADGTVHRVLVGGINVSRSL